MAAPTGRVLSLSVPACRRPIQYRLDAAAQTAGGFGLARPDRLDRLQHQVGIDVSHGPVTEHGIGIGLQRRSPLALVLVIAPGSLVRLDIGFGGRLECDRPGGIHGRRFELALPMVHGIDTASEQLARGQRLFTRLGQRHQIHRTDAHDARPALESIPDQPRLRPGRPDIEPEVPTVAITARLLDRRHLSRGQLARRRHPDPPDPWYTLLYTLTRVRSKSRWVGVDKRHR